MPSKSRTRWTRRTRQASSTGTSSRPRYSSRNAPRHPDVPPKLDEIIDRCLEKDRELRFHSAADVRANLKRVQRDIDSERARTSSRAPVEDEALPPDAPPRTGSSPGPGGPAATVALQPSSDAALIVGVVQRHKTG